MVAPELSENGVGSELMLKPGPLIEALETTTVEVPGFLTASVCVTLFPTGTVPNDTPAGVEVSEAARMVPGARNMTAALNMSAGKNAKYRREGPPGWMLFKKVCWENPQKRFWKIKSLVLEKFIPDTGYGPRST